MDLILLPLINLVFFW